MTMNSFKLRVFQVIVNFVYCKCRDKTYSQFMDRRAIVIYLLGQNRWRNICYKTFGVQMDPKENHKEKNVSMTPPPDLSAGQCRSNPLKIICAGFAAVTVAIVWISLSIRRLRNDYEHDYDLLDEDVENLYTVFGDDEKPMSDKVTLH
jgi:hypothetical protein